MITIRIDVDGNQAQGVEVAAPSSSPVATTPRAAVSWLKALDFDLSERELEVLRMAATGMQYKQVATNLGISERTVRSHMNNIYARTGLQNNTMLVSWAWLCGLLTEQDIILAWRDIAPHLVELA